MRTVRESSLNKFEEEKCSKRELKKSKEACLGDERLQLA